MGLWKRRRRQRWRTVDTPDERLPLFERIAGRSTPEQRLAARASLETKRALDLDVPNGAWSVTWATRRGGMDVGALSARVSPTCLARLNAAGLSIPSGWSLRLEYARVPAGDIARDETRVIIEASAA